VRLVLLDPPGWHRLWPHGVPHWPYASAVDQELNARGIPPGIVRADVALRPYYEKGRRDRIYMTLTWDVSRTGARGGARLSWDDETGWSYAQLGTDKVAGGLLARRGSGLPGDAQPPAGGLRSGK
jgi:hypothetical protein